MDFSFDNCSDYLNKMNDLQLFLLSGACPDSLKNSLLEQQLDFIELLNMKLALLNDSLPEVKVDKQNLDDSVYMSINYRGLDFTLAHIDNITVMPINTTNSNASISIVMKNDLFEFSVLNNEDLNLFMEQFKQSGFAYTICENLPLLT